MISSRNFGEKKSKCKKVFFFFSSNGNEGSGRGGGRTRPDIKEIMKGSSTRKIFQDFNFKHSKRPSEDLA